MPVIIDLRHYLKKNTKTKKIIKKKNQKLYPTFLNTASDKYKLLQEANITVINDHKKINLNSIIATIKKTLN